MKLRQGLLNIAAFLSGFFSLCTQNATADIALAVSAKAGNVLGCFFLWCSLPAASSCWDGVTSCITPALMSFESWQCHLFRSEYEAETLLQLCWKAGGKWQEG